MEVTPESIRARALPPDVPSKSSRKNPIKAYEQLVNATVVAKQPGQSPDMRWHAAGEKFRYTGPKASWFDVIDPGEVAEEPKEEVKPKRQRAKPAPKTDK